MRVNFKKELLLLGIFIVAVFCVCGNYRRMKNDSIQSDIAKKILRFHVIANSDNVNDQNVKLKVRDGVLDYLEPLFSECDDKEDCKDVISQNVEGIKSAAEEILRSEGFDENVNISVGTRYFPVKKYGDYTFPQGEYEALCVEIGKAEGKNWWCVLYPRLCFVDSLYAVVPDGSKEELKGILTDEEYKAVFTSKDSKIKIKSGILEFFKK